MNPNQTHLRFIWIQVFSDQSLRHLFSLLTTYDNRSKRLFSCSIRSNRYHYTADYMLLLQDRRRGEQWIIEAVFAFHPCPIVRLIYVASICLFLLGLAWMSFRGWRCDEHPRHPSMQRCPAWYYACLRPISSEDGTYKEAICSSD